MSNIGWETVPLGSLVSITTGKKDVNEGAEDGEYPFFTCSKKAARSHSYSFDTEAMLIAGNGEVGHLQYYNGKFEAYQRTYVLTGFKANSGYLRHFIQGFFTDHLATQHAGSVIQFIKLKDLADFSIRLPKNEPEQQKIIEILDTLDTQIRQTEVIIAKLQQVKQGLLRDLLTRGINANGQLRPPRDQAPELYKESPLGWIPKEWEAALIGNCCSLVRDGTHLPPLRTSTGPLLLSVRNIQNGKLILTDQDTRVPESFYQQMHRNWELMEGDVLLAIVGATIGKSAIVGKMPKFTLQRSVAVLRGKERELDNHYLHTFIISNKFQSTLMRKINQTAQPGIYLDQLCSCEIPLPKYDEQGRIINVVNSHYHRLEKERKRLQKLRKQKSGLMDDLLTGRVRVNQLIDTAKAS